MERLLLAILALLIVSIARADLVRSSLEDMPSDEPTHWHGIQDSTQATVQHGYDLEVAALKKRKRELPAHAVRDTHAKGHGCVKAEWVPMAADAPAGIKQGMFAATEPMRAWIRYSNAGGNIGADKAPDARGMAVKVLIGSELGARLADAPETRTQDFTAVNSPTFFVRNAAEDDTLLHAVMDSFLSQSSSPGVTRLGHLLGLASFVAPRAGTLEGKLALRATQAPEAFNPLQIQYWSQVAYLLGTDASGIPQAMKYSFKPCAGSPVDSAARQKSNREKPNGFRYAMRDQLATGSACFDVLVQLEPGPKLDVNWIEDPRQEWTTPFVKVAELRIPSQTFLSREQKDFCENLSFNPLNSLEVHQPLGWANRVRVAVYGLISKLRHALNLKPVAEPTWTENFIGLPDEAADVDLL